MCCDSWGRKESDTTQRLPCPFPAHTAWHGAGAQSIPAGPLMGASSTQASRNPHTEAAALIAPRKVGW